MFLLFCFIALLNEADIILTENYDYHGNYYIDNNYEANYNGDSNNYEANYNGKSDNEANKNAGNKNGVKNGGSVLLLSLDGLHSNQLKTFSPGSLPTFERLMSNGATANYVQPVFPSEGFPSWTTISTGNISIMFLKFL